MSPNIGRKIEMWVENMFKHFSNAFEISWEIFETFGPEIFSKKRFGENILFFYKSETLMEILLEKVDF